MVTGREAHVEAGVAGVLGRVPVGRRLRGLGACGGRREAAKPQSREGKTILFSCRLRGLAAWRLRVPEGDPHHMRSKATEPGGNVPPSPWPPRAPRLRVL